MGSPSKELALRLARAGCLMMLSALSGSGRADALVAQPADQLGDHLIAPEGWHQVDALDQVPGIGEELARLRKSLRDAVLAGCSHAVAKLLRDDDAGDLVVHELGVA